jgi:hypothetical protein
MKNLILIRCAALIHLGFIAFIIFGGLLITVIPQLIWAHILCAIYGILMVTIGWRCPLSQYEAQLRVKRGQDINANDWEFLAHYIFRHIGLRGNEWFVSVIFVCALISFNYQPYQRIFST